MKSKILRTVIFSIITISVISIINIKTDYVRLVNNKYELYNKTEILQKENNSLRQENLSLKLHFFSRG